MIKKLLHVHPKFWAFVLSLLTIISIWTYCSQQLYLSRQARRLEELQARQRTLIEENAELQHKIDFTYTDEYIIREARSKLRLIMPGEVLFESID